MDRATDGITSRKLRKRRATEKHPDLPGRKVPIALWHWPPAALGMVKAALGWRKAPSKGVFMGEALK